MTLKLVDGTITGRKYWVLKTGKDDSEMLHFKLSYKEYQQMMDSLGVTEQDDPKIAEAIENLLAGGKRK